MALQWTPLRLSMVSGNGLSSAVSRPSYRTYRKMADIGVQYDLQDADPQINSTVAEINSPSEIQHNETVDIAEIETASRPASSRNSFYRPHSVESSSSSSSHSEVHERRRPSPTNQELDVDAICVQSVATEDVLVVPEDKKPSDKTELDGFVIEEKENESSCGLDCVYFTMQCCECTIL